MVQAVDASPIDSKHGCLYSIICLCALHMAIIDAIHYGIGDCLHAMRLLTQQRGWMSHRIMDDETLLNMMGNAFRPAIRLNSHK